MKKIINHKVYNTETAELLGEEWNALGRENYHYHLEELYITKKENMFLYVSTFDLDRIIPLELDEAFDWLAKHDCFESIDKYFSDKLQEA